MTRITPRTCLYPLTASLLLTFGLSIGLTFRSNHHCFAGTCGEWLFPLQARLHIVVWYFWISVSVTFLAVRAFSPALRRLLCQPLTQKKLPVVGKQLAISGSLNCVWIISLYGILVGIWWIRLRDYFVQRGRDGHITQGNRRLATTALTGHFCDVTMGMVLIPVSRHSALAAFFKLSTSTTLAFHKITAYALFVLVLIHLSVFSSWLVIYNDYAELIRPVFPVLNPTYLYNEVWPGSSTSLGIWRASLIFTGIATTAIFGLIFITTLQPVRRKHFNTFYFTHLLSIVAVVIVCLHASTMLYCTAPGLAMWALDWGMRLFELRQSLNGKITTIGNGWYSLSLQLPRRRLDGCACTSPLAHFYIHHSGTSTRELHPFTTTTHLASQNAVTPKEKDEIPIEFLFRKSITSKSAANLLPNVGDGFATAFGLFSTLQKPRPEWTSKLAGILDEPESALSDAVEPKSGVLSKDLSTPTSRPQSSVTLHPKKAQPVTDLHLRLEGPYFTPADPARYDTVVCLVAGTGISGAIAIAHAFVESIRQRTSPPRPEDGKKEPVDEIGMASKNSSCNWRRCVIIWTVKADDYVDIPFFKENSTSVLDVRINLTGGGRPRLDITTSLNLIVEESINCSTWVYISGPNSFILAGESACKATPGVHFYGARWDA